MTDPILEKRRKWFGAIPTRLPRMFFGKSCQAHSAKQEKINTDYEKIKLFYLKKISSSSGSNSIWDGVCVTEVEALETLAEWLWLVWLRVSSKSSSSMSSTSFIVSSGIPRSSWSTSSIWSIKAAISTDAWDRGEILNSKLVNFREISAYFWKRLKRNVPQKALLNFCLWLFHPWRISRALEALVKSKLLIDSFSDHFRLFQEFILLLHELVELLLFSSQLIGNGNCWSVELRVVWRWNWWKFFFSCNVQLANGLFLVVWNHETCLSADGSLGSRVFLRTVQDRL